MERCLIGKVVLVTGGGTGIGLATARACAVRGADVVITSRRQDVLDRAAAGADTIRPVVADVTGAADVDRLVEDVGTRFGRLDVLVNSAAVTGGGALAELDDDVVAAVLATNLVAPIRLTRACLPLLTASGGVVVNVSTATGGRGWPGSSTYAATKAALDSLTRSWAVELAGVGVRVVGVAPGAIRTPIGVHNGMTPAQVDALRERQIDRTPLGRLGEPEEIALAVVAMASGAAGFVTGAILVVDGGAAIA